MHVSRALVCLALFSLAACVQAQLGSTDAAVCARYGKPIAESEAASGVRIATYTNGSLTIDTGSFSGEVRRVVFRKPGLDDPEISALLTQNRGEADWEEEWQPAGQPGPRRVWHGTRPPAMARLDPDTLTIVRADWFDPGAAPAEAALKPVSPANLATEGAMSTRPPEPIVYKRAEQPEELPRPGDTRVRVVEMLGDPKGVMRWGRHESLFYAWGVIDLENGKVVGIK